MTLSAQPIEGDLFPGGDGAARTRVLVCLDRYLPGTQYGGPIRSLANMVFYLSSHFDFYIVTKDRDVMDKKPYEGVTPDKWHRVGESRVLYCSSVRPSILQRAYREVRPDAIYLNEMWVDFTRLMLVLNRVGEFGDTPVVVAPRGAFSPGALAIKGAKKFVYMKLAKFFGMHDGVTWQATTPRETLDLLRAAPARNIDPNSIRVAYNINDAEASTAPHASKRPGDLEMVFIGRISEMKNLHFLLEILAQVVGRVRLNIYGPIAGSDQHYWDQCQAKIARLPENVAVDYRGPLEHNAVPGALHEHHFFVLPTKGENFCHAAVESLINGTPVVLSDETPWVNLNDCRAGFDLPLDDRAAWVSAIQQCVDMDSSTYRSYLEGARAYGRQFSVESAVAQHVELFATALKARSLGPLVTS
jgi:glycosyltransferase involved in cell wall biosynthesis